jgi:Acetyltransferase (GNAT) domain
MSVVLRRVSPVEDREELLDLLKRNLGASQEQRFEWRHANNPAGTSWSWFAYDRNSKATIAMASVFPRHMVVHGNRTMGGQVGDFVVDAGYRSLGPAVLLQRATFEPVDSGELDFCYDCPPHDRGMSTFVRLGMHANCEVNRYALPLRSDMFLEKRLGNAVWTKPLVAVANLLLKLKITAHHCTPGIEIAALEGPFGDEFSKLDNDSYSDTIRASRSKENLTWRYKDDPLAAKQLPTGTQGQYRVLVARRAGELLAFVVFFIQSDGIASIVDLFGRELSVVGRSLLEAAIDNCREEHVYVVHGFCSKDSALKLLFESSGFRARARGARVVAYASPGRPTGPLLNSGRWSFSQVEILV